MPYWTNASYLDLLAFRFLPSIWVCRPPAVWQPHLHRAGLSEHRFTLTNLCWPSYSFSQATNWGPHSNQCSRRSLCEALPRDTHAKRAQHQREARDRRLATKADARPQPKSRKERSPAQDGAKALELDGSDKTKSNTKKKNTESAGRTKHKSASLSQQTCSRRRMSRGFQYIHNQLRDLLDDDEELKKALDDINLDAAEARIGYRFKNKHLLRDILVIGATLDKRPNLAAWLGDSVLYFLTTKRLASFYKGISVHDLHSARQMLVSRQACAKIAEQLQLKEFVVLTPALRGQPYYQDENNHLTVNVAGELVEALIGAIYLDGGLAAVSSFLNFVKIWPSLKDIATSQAP